MHITQSLGRLALSALLGAGFGAAHATTYTVNESLGAGGVTGSITTDGHVGVLGAADITGWNLLLTGTGGVTWRLQSADGLSGFAISDMGHEGGMLPSSPDLTADARHIYFDFSATDGGIFGFEAFPIGGSAHYWCNAAMNAVDCDAGRSVAPLNDADPSSILVATSGVRAIATVSAVPEPSTLALALSGAAVLGLRVRRGRKG